MIGKPTTMRPRTSQGRGLWPVLVVLLVAVLVPTACVLWFMNAAMHNERLAVRQRLTDVYRQKVQTDQNEIATFWSLRTSLPADRQGVQLFAAIVRSGIADGVVVRSEAGGVIYPPIEPPLDASVPTSQPVLENGELWAKANDLEYAQARPIEAAAEYAKIAAPSKDTTTQARAWGAQVRCFAKAKTDRLADSLKLVTAHLGQDPYRNAVDLQGRLIVPNVQLLVLQQIIAAKPDGQSRPADFQRILDDLGSRLEDYRDPSMSSPQRRFLMKALQEDLHARTFDTLAAEELTEQYLPRPQPAAEKLRVTPASLPGLWQMASADGRCVLLFREHELLAGMKAACKLGEPFAGITTTLELPGRRDPARQPFLSVPVSEHCPGWELAVYLNEDPFAVTAGKAESAYLAGGISAIAVIALLAVAMASYLGRQMRLTRLKNDLIATVSHELKTPLASMRVLVDTLREGRCTDSKQAGEYFELIAKENERLSRLIDNFLTFSRMERNKRAFDFTAVDIAEAVQAAADATSERFSSPQARLDMDLPGDLPHVRADRDAIVTVILNLLDNAWKYSGDIKAIQVRAYPVDGSVFIDVSDNGVGMSRREMNRIFDKFYQVDQTLARKASGCGLGLSIVKFILDAHGGAITVKSQPGKGSTFTIQLPVATDSRLA